MMGQIVLLPIYENFEAIRANGFFPVIINYSSVDCLLPFVISCYFEPY